MSKLERTAADLSASLEQAAAIDVFAHEAAGGLGTIATDIRITRVTIEYEVDATRTLERGRRMGDRTPMDVVREVAEAARTTGGCGGIIAVPQADGHD